MAGDHVLSVENAVKLFAGNVRALNGTSLHVRRGEVHCILGANGAGKSTLLKVIAGAHMLTSGTLSIDGVSQRFRSPQEAAAAGISMIYQELDLIPQLTVAQNMFLGRPPACASVIRRGARRARAQAALERVKADFGPDAIVGSLSIAKQQLTAIARSLTMEAKVIVMDEPSAALNERELMAVFDVVRSLAREGVAIIYVSHRMPEIREIGDRVTVIRNGASVATYELADTPEQELVEAVLGRNQALLQRSDRLPPREHVALDVRHLRGPQGLDLRGISIRAGEIIGLSGLNGAGRTTFIRALFGDVRFEGDVSLNGRDYAPRRPADAIRRGVALVPEDRKTQGLVLGSAIYRNATLASLSRSWLMTHRTLRAQARRPLSDLSTRFASLEQPVRQLSGGNQQKVVFSKWILADSRILLLDEPSRGLDVGAKAELYAQVRRMAEAGASVLVASSELDEIYVNCDRIWFFTRGAMSPCSIRPCHPVTTFLKPD